MWPFLHRHLIQIEQVRNINSSVAVTNINYGTELPP
jgi:hypothetical protein